jgi:hypothetical protein
LSKLIVVAQCKDPVKWEQGFRTHADLFKSQTVNKPISYGIEGNQVAVCLEPDDFATCMNVMDSPATATAMDFDGILRDTVKMFVLDHELRV